MFYICIHSKPLFMRRFSSIEICAGAGGQALGLESAGFDHLALVEIDRQACNTLRRNRPEWNVLEQDARQFDATSYQSVDLFAAGVPCPPFSIAGKQLGQEDERDMFPHALRIVEECQPSAILIENVKGILSKRFDLYRRRLEESLTVLGYTGEWKLLISADYGVPQLRPRAVYVGFKDDYFDYFSWPEKEDRRITVGEILYKEMASNGWGGATAWKQQANDIAPTLVGGSKKHGGADLGPTRAKQSWLKLGVDGKGIANEAPASDFEGIPRLTTKMAALIQGFPASWEFVGKKTPVYRQIGNAFPPPVAAAVARRIISALRKENRACRSGKVLELNFESTL